MDMLIIPYMPFSVYWSQCISACDIALAVTLLSEMFRVTELYWPLSFSYHSKKYYTAERYRKIINFMVGFVLFFCAVDGWTDIFSCLFPTNCVNLSNKRISWDKQRD